MRERAESAAEAVERERLARGTAHPHEQLVPERLARTRAQADDRLRLEAEIVVLERVLQVRGRDEVARPEQRHAARGLARLDSIPSLLLRTLARELRRREQMRD